MVGTLGAVAAAGLAVTAVQLGGTDQAPPEPAISVTTPASTGTLADGTAYAVMPLEGKEPSCPTSTSDFPRTIDPAATAEAFSTARPPHSFVAVYLRADGEHFQPVLVTAVGRQVQRRLRRPRLDQRRDGNAATRWARGPSAGAA